MKTPMQEHIEWLEKEYKKFYKDTDVPRWFYNNGIEQALNHAESMLEKEKKFMQKVYDNAKATGEMDEAVRTFNTKEK